MTRSLLAATLVSSLSALAQSEPPPPPPPMVAMPTDAPLEEEGRVRWGVDGQIGVLIPQVAVLFGAEGRVGYQFNRSFAVYANLGANGGFGIGASVDSSGRVTTGSISVAGWWKVGVLAELTVADRLALAAGPALASGGWAGVSATAGTNGGSATTVVAGGFMPAIDVKVGLGLGNRNPRTGRRQGFNLGLDLMILFAPNAAYVTAAGSGSGGSAEVRTSGLAVGFAPSLTLGFDAR